jgi:hypothetical protein
MQGFGHYSEQSGVVINESHSNRSESVKSMKKKNNKKKSFHQDDQLFQETPSWGCFNWCLRPNN